MFGSMILKHSLHVISSKKVKHEILFLLKLNHKQSKYTKTLIDNNAPKRAQASCFYAFL